MLAVLALAVSTTSTARTGHDYATQGQCQGLPRLPLGVAAGFCAGLAAQDLGMPRGILPLADGTVLVTDLGSWDRGRGRLLRLVPHEGRYEVRVLLEHLNRPHGLRLGPDGLVYLGEDDRIARFDPAHEPPRLQTLVQGLPHAGRHPLKTFEFLPDGSLLLNVGAPSNNCAEAKGLADCPAAQGAEAAGALWRLWPQDGRWQHEVYALGLRNSVALAYDARSGRLWQGENARDAIVAAMAQADASQAPASEAKSDEDLPHDELNLVRRGANYGWPYCYDDGLPSPEFPQARCERYEKPVLLLPAHAAPLGMLVLHDARLPPPWRDALLLSLHGYRRHGHRIVAVPLDAAGMPTGALVPLVEGWDGKPGVAPMGAPTDIQRDAQGGFWVTEDRNGTVLRIAPETAAAAQSSSSAANPSSQAAR